MITVREALEAVLAVAHPLSACDVPLEAALGRCLAEQVTSDVDSPPHDKALVDGYAVVSSDFALSGAPTETPRELEVLEEVVAGAVPTRPVGPGAATRIMTGAPIPPGADAVVMVEDSELISTQRVRVRTPAVKPSQNILPRAVAMKRGDIVLTAGAGESPRWLRPADIGLLAEVGRETVRVIRQPQAAILSTGNELVQAGQTPGPGQIRNSNSPMLVAQVQSAGAAPRNLGIARDERDELRRLISAGLTADVLILSGGVSAGVLDLVPGVLAELGVRQVFHKVNLKPGKPLWFGVREDGDHVARSTLVFGLPGNPVSSLVCFELFVRPALRRLAGEDVTTLATTTARLTREFTHRGNRPTYHPARLVAGEAPTVTPVAWQGSADLRALAEANALIHFAAEDRLFPAGQEVEVLLLA